MPDEQALEEMRCELARGKLLQSSSLTPPGRSGFAHMGGPGTGQLYLGAWKHGLSIYGWQQARDDAFTSRHPALKTSQGTLQLRPVDAAAIPDDELRHLVRDALEA